VTIFFRKPVEEIQDALKSDKNNWYFEWRPTHINASISRSSF